MFRAFKLLLIMAVVCCCAARGQVNSKVVVYEIPAGIETYVPVTQDDIEERAFKVIFLRNEKQASEVLSLIHATSEAPNFKRIRVKIVNGDDSYVFDSNGIGISSAGKSVAIDIAKLSMILSM